MRDDGKTPEASGYEEELQVREAPERRSEGGGGGRRSDGRTTRSARRRKRALERRGTYDRRAAKRRRDAEELGAVDALELEFEADALEEAAARAASKRAGDYVLRRYSGETSAQRKRRRDMLYSLWGRLESEPRPRCAGCDSERSPTQWLSQQDMCDSRESWLLWLKMVEVLVETHGPCDSCRAKTATS